MRSRLKGGRAGAVAAQSLEPFAIAGVDEHPCMNVEAVDLGGPRALAAAAVILVRVEHDAATDAEEGPAEERQLHAGLESRDLRRLVGALLGGPFVEELAASQPLRHALADAGRDLCDLLA